MQHMQALSCAFIFSSHPSVPYIEAPQNLLKAQCKRIRLMAVEYQGSPVRMVSRHYADLMALSCCITRILADCEF